MKLWTMQPVEVYDILKRDGIFICDKEKADNIEFLEAYDWLNKYLEKKDPKPGNVEYPIWAWFRFNSMEKKPDLRHSCYGRRGQKMVCIEVEIPDEKVLLSDYDNWHYVLNKCWLDDSMCEEEWDELHDWFDALPLPKQDEIREKSWEKIFDTTIWENEWRSNGKYIQAIFWELKMENVKKVQFFTAR